MEKCTATGKVIFDSSIDAKDRIEAFRQNIKKRRNGRRRKHRQGKAAQKRVYYCAHCKGYHLTRWEDYVKKNKTDKALLDMLIIKRTV